jgi:hypothetical protein
MVQRRRRLSRDCSELNQPDGDTWSVSHVCTVRQPPALPSSLLTVPPPPSPPSCAPPVEKSHTGRPYIDPPAPPSLPSVHTQDARTLTHLLLLPFPLCTHRTPGHYAAFYGHADCLKAMLARGADPNSCNLNGCSILHFAAGEEGAGLFFFFGGGGGREK